MFHNLLLKFTYSSQVNAKLRIMPTSRSPHSVGFKWGVEIKKETEQRGSMREAYHHLCSRGGTFFICLNRRHDLSCSLSKLNIPRKGFFVSEFPQCICFDMWHKVEFNKYIEKKNHTAAGMWISSSFLLQWLVERFASYSFSLKLTSGTELTVSRPYRAIHPEVQKWHQAAACARWWRLPPTLS